MDKEKDKNTRRWKLMFTSATICGVIGAFIGFMAGLTLEGAGSGLIAGWMIGEIYGIGIAEIDE